MIIFFCIICLRLCYLHTYTFPTLFLSVAYISHSNFQWSKIFPNEQITETKSSLFVKKLLAIAVSNIAYLRAIFPEHAFGDRSLEGNYLPRFVHFSWVAYYNKIVLSTCSR